MSEASEEKVKGIIVEQLGVSADKVTREAKVVEDLGADSLDAVELVMAVEEEFGVEVPDDEAEGLTTVGAIIDYVEKASSLRVPIRLLQRAGWVHGPALFFFDSE